MKRKATGPLNSVASWVVVIVDDTPDNLIVAKTALNYYGAQVHTATNGEDGLALLETVTPTVVLLDIRMPRMDGLTMIKHIRANPRTAHLPVIAVTAYAMNSDKDEILKTGFDGYMPKPFDMFTFVADIEKCISAKLERQATETEDSSV